MEDARNEIYRAIHRRKKRMVEDCNKDKSLECSAEGHVSHIYSERMSSRPLGWSRTGADKMAQLRVYYYNTNLKTHLRCGLSFVFLQ